jgi:glycerol-1-phosphate dehydrogenase [NAD(P)+]
MDQQVGTIQDSDGADAIARLLEGRYLDPDSGRPVGVGTRSLVIAPSLAGSEGDLVAGLGFGRRVAVVSDPATHAALGDRVERALAGRFAVQSLVLPADPLPDMPTAQAIRRETRSADALIAVGSGTINDLCKFAAALDGKPYAVFATAPSMNGYTSQTAAITESGMKKSLAAQAPRGAFFDLAVLAAAPPRLIRAGLGDSLCRTTAQADWLLAHLLLGRPYRTLPFALLQDDEPDLFAHAADLMAGSHEVMERLVRTLVLSGFGTAIVGSSEPASQGEHLVSHYIDMFADPARPVVFHGEQVGVTTLSAARLQHAMLETRPVVFPDNRSEADFRARYGDEVGASCWREFAPKALDRDKAEAMNARLSLAWDGIRDAVTAVLLPHARLRDVLAAAGAPLTCDAIALPRPFYEAALLGARDVRDRYTFFDLAADSRRLPDLVARL